MLVLTRRLSERILIGDKIMVQVVRISDTCVGLGIQAPAEMPIHREEIAAQIAEQQRELRVADPDAEPEEPAAESDAPGDAVGQRRQTLRAAIGHLHVIQELLREELEYVRNIRTRGTIHVAGVDYEHDEALSILTDTAAFVECLRHRIAERDLSLTQACRAADQAETDQPTEPGDAA